LNYCILLMKKVSILFVLAIYVVHHNARFRKCKLSFHYRRHKVEQINPIAIRQLLTGCHTPSAETRLQEIKYGVEAEQPLRPTRYRSQYLD
jgi:hypothetical protein